MSILGDAYRALLACTNPVLVPLENHWLARRAPRDGELRSAVERSIEKGLRWFEPQELLEISALFVFRRLFLQGEEPRLRFVEEKIENYRRRFKSFRRRMFDRDYPYDPTLDPRGEHITADDEVYAVPIDPMMRRCLFADRLGLGEEFLEELAGLDDGGGYGTTHIVVGGLVLKEFSDIDPAKIDSVMATTIPAICAAQRNSRAGDLFAERIAALQWLGRHDLVELPWILRLLRAQNRDGGWAGRPGWRARVSNQHTSALALTALIFFRNTRWGRSPRAPMDAKSEAEAVDQPKDG